MNIGAVLTEAWRLYTRFFTRFVGIAAIVFLIVGLADALLRAVAGDGALVYFIWALFSVAVSIVGYFWLQGALVEAVRDVRDGSVDASVQELFARVRPRLPALISAGILAGLGIAVGLVLLIVPGLYLLTRWSMIAPAIVLEGRSAGESFGRSSDLVRGESWNVFAVILLTIVAAAIGGGIIGGIIGLLLAPLPDLLASWIASIVVNSIVAPWVALAWTVMYFHLARRESVPAPPPAAAA
jgi:Membrane domain of glycerophosphoryl diester phosphodiesterase